MKKTKLFYYFELCDRGKERALIFLFRSANIIQIYNKFFNTYRTSYRSDCPHSVPLIDMIYIALKDKNYNCFNKHGYPTYSDDMELNGNEGIIRNKLPL